ncbi:hypothetical protein IKG73_02255 [Candidatus Saccharibacteria bacterium]|nr:hypothetical protein [Candidatus Saccharibacteria bacterium]
MTTAEIAIAKMNRLNGPNLEKASRYIEKLFAKQEKTAPKMKTYTEKELLELFDKADEDIKAGRVYTLEQDREHVKKKYGF